MIENACGVYVDSIEVWNPLSKMTEKAVFESTYKRHETGSTHQIYYEVILLSHMYWG
jgi:hypothetical protein